MPAATILVDLSYRSACLFVATLTCRALVLPRLQLCDEGPSTQALHLLGDEKLRDCCCQSVAVRQKTLVLNTSVSGKIRSLLNHCSVMQIPDYGCKLGFSTWVRAGQNGSQLRSM